MTFRAPRTGRRPASALLAAVLLLAPATRADELDDVRKEIAATEKQLADLQKRLDELKSRTPAAPGTVPADYARKLAWRCIGPANMGGRVTALAVVESDPTTYYVATASGGLLKTTNNGTTFSHLFEKEGTVSIGDVAVAPSDPKVVWVGTGEANPRNSVSYGDGVYKSTDGGKTWANMGLKKSFQVGKVVIHPKDPNTVYVAALGRLYGPSEERGVFKTADGGKTWAKVLYVDDKTGAIELAMDPFDPNVLLAGMWERKRDGFDGVYGDVATWPSPDQYGPDVTYGPGGGLFRTADAGKTWTKLTGEKAAAGLPTVKTGRIGLDFSRKTKGLVYAILDTEKVGTGRPPLTVYMGLTSENAKGGGVLVESEPESDTPVGKAGLKQGDVITALDGAKVADYDDLMDFMAKKKPGEVVKFAAARGGKDQTFDVTLEAKKAEGPPPPPTIGVRFVRPGLTVDTVTEGGPAAKAGLKAGDVVTAVAGAKVADQKELVVALGKGKAGEKVKVTVNRGGKPVELEVVPAAAPPRVPSTRPFQLAAVVGGQQANVHKDQGKQGFQTGGVYQSGDGGKTWKRANSLNPRPFYFSQVRCDPNDDKVAYVLGDTQLWRSGNGGEKFAAAPAKGVHPDHHALWINPKDSRHMLLGCDGGFYATFDRGETWDHLNVLALGQFYHVAVDNRKPYNVYGGLQDNGSWGGPSRTLRGTGPVNDDWLFILGGDGFTCRVDPSDPDIVYATSQNGGMNRRNLRTGESKGLGRGPVKADEPLRWNWNTPFVLSGHNPGIFYAGAQYVFRSVKRGEDLKPISPDLTASKKGTLTAVAESPRTPDVLWAGTDDGNVWVTKDGGGKWENVLDKLKAAGLPGPRWVASLEPSRVADGRCYVCLDAHRSDDDKPYLYATEDYGATWKPVTGNLPAFGSTRVLREDLTNPDVLYCGTEFGIWASVNRGQSWANVNGNLPTVAVHEVAQPATASEIVVATHGRSVWVLDVASLRQMSARAEKAEKGEKAVDPLAEAVTLFAPPVATRWKLEGGREFPYSKDARKFYGTNPAPGVAFEYLVTKPGKAASLKVTDVSGAVVREFRTAPAEAGFHRLVWNLSGPGGTVPAGAYRVTLAVDGKEYAQSLAVENDPKADPKAVIAYDARVPGAEDDGEDEEAVPAPRAKKD